jgi:tRNA 2-thiocytidine biosynthesis protein TtcA
MPPAMINDLDDIHPVFSGAPQTTEFRKLRKRIIRCVREAMEQYGMTDGRDARWLVCLSGARTATRFSRPS